MRKGAITEVLRAVLAALALGALVWYIARNEISDEKPVEALVQLADAGEFRLTAKDGGPPRVTVILTGPILPRQRARDAILRQEVVGRRKLSGQELALEGPARIPVVPTRFELPDPRVRLRIENRDEELLLTPMATLTKPVRLVTDLDLDSSLHRVRALHPGDVSVRGPKAVLNQITEVRTKFLALKEISDTGRPGFQGYLDIDKVVVLDGEEVRLECDERVYVIIEFGEKIKEKEFANVPVRVNTETDYPYDVSIVAPEDQTVTVVVSGPESVLSKTTVDDIDVYLKVGNAQTHQPGPTPVALPRRYRLPADLRLVSISGPEDGKVSVDILKRTAPAP